MEQSRVAASGTHGQAIPQVPLRRAAKRSGAARRRKASGLCKFDTLLNSYVGSNYSEGEAALTVADMDLAFCGLRGQNSVEYSRAVSHPFPTDSSLQVPQSFDNVKIR